MIYNVTGILIGLAVFLWIRWRRKQFTIFKELGIPGPEPSIFFGNVREMIQKGPISCQNDWIKKYGDVLGNYYGTWPTLLVSNPDILKQVLIKDFPSFTDRPTDFFAVEGDRPNHPSSHHMINSKGKKWKEMRSLLTPSFTTGKLKKMMPLLTNSVKLMVSKLEAASGNGSKDVDIYPLYRGMTMDAITRVAFGIETSVQDDKNFPLMKLAKLILSADFSSLFNLLFVSFREFDLLLQPLRNIMLLLYNKGSNPLDEIYARLGKIVKLRKENPASRRPDVLQAMIDARASQDDISDHALTASAEVSDAELNANDTGKTSLTKGHLKLSDSEVQANVFLLFFAGYETTSTTIALLTHHMINNMSVQDKMRKEIMEVFGNDDTLDYDRLMKLNYTDRAISESLRLNPPVFSFVMRVANRDVQLGKWKIPAGMTVQVPVNYLHQNPEFFDNPSAFNPDRFLPENRGKNHSVTWVPFGSGPRNCVGMRLALLEIKMALVTMLRKFKLEPCGKTEMGSLTFHYNFAIASPKKGIYARAVPI